jgi:signal transduction histidine kinase
MARKRGAFFKHVGGAEFANPLNFVFALPVLIFGGVAAGTDLSASTNAFTYGLINLVTLAFVALILLSFYHWRLRSKNNFAFGLILLFAAFLGLVKAASTAWLAVLAGLETDLQHGLEVRATGSVAAAVLVIGSTAILKGIQEALIEDRDHLLALKLRRRFSERLANALKQIDQAVEELQGLGSAETRRKFVLEKLGALNEREVRPLAHSIWSDQTGHVMFSSKRLFFDSIYFQKQSPLALAAISILVTPGLFRIGDWSQGQFVALAMVTFGVALMIWVGNIVRTMVPQQYLVSSWLSVMLVGSAITYAAAQLIANGQLDDNYLFDVISSFVFFTASGLALSALSAFFRKGAAVRSELKEEADEGDLANQLGEDFLRNVASAIHGRLQNRITLAMVRISDGADLETELREIRNLIIEIGRTHSVAEVSEPAELIARWRGFLAVEFVAAPESWSHNHELIIDEALANSFRHGKASEARVAVAADGTIEIRDNGQLTAGRKPGMGSSLFTDLAEWNLSKDGSETVFRARVKN